MRLRDDEGLPWRGIGGTWNPAMTALDSYRQSAPSACTELILSIRNRSSHESPLTAPQSSSRDTGHFKILPAFPIGGLPARLPLPTLPVRALPSFSPFQRKHIGAEPPKNLALVCQPESRQPDVCRLPAARARAAFSDLRSAICRLTCSSLPPSRRLRKNLNPRNRKIRHPRTGRTRKTRNP